MFTSIKTSKHLITHFISLWKGTFFNAAAAAFFNLVDMLRM